LLEHNINKVDITVPDDLVAVDDENLLDELINED